MAKKMEEDMQSGAETETAVEAEPAAETETVTLQGGLEAAEEHLAQFDEDVSMLWSVRGPKKGRIESIGMFLVTPKGLPPAKILVLAMKSGAFQLNAPVTMAPPASESE